MKNTRYRKAARRVLYRVVVTVRLSLPAFTARSQDLGGISKARPVHIAGSLSPGINTYATNDSIKAMNPVQWSVSGSPVLSIYGLNLPFNIFISSQTRSLHTPFTRFGVSPYYKWAKLHLGWRSHDFNQFALGGQQILGAGFELTPVKLDVAFMYGRFNHAVTDVSVYNNLNNTVPVYNRNGCAFKLGYGDDKTGVSFSYLHARYDESSANPKIVALSNISSTAFLRNFMVDSVGVFEFNGKNDKSPVTEGLEAFGFDRKVELHWNRHEIGGFDAYYIERSEDGGKTFHLLNRLPFSASYHLPPVVAEEKKCLAFLR